MKNQLFIISGGAGFGKTSIIKMLIDLGFKAGEEYAREIIYEQSRIGGEILPWKNINLFQQEVFKKRKDFYESVGDDEIAFSDRGIPDQFAFARYKGFSPKRLLENANKYRYASTVFIASPWSKIFKQDQVRKESFEEAVEMHNIVCEVYKELDYSLVELPKASVSERVSFILNYIKTIY